MKKPDESEILPTVADTEHAEMMECDEIKKLLRIIDGLDELKAGGTGIDSEKQENTDVLFNIGELKAKGFLDVQIHEITLGMDEHLSVKRYAKECFNWMQMREIRLGLIKEIDTSYYDNQLFSADQMKEIRRGLEDGLDVTTYANLLYATSDMKQQRRALLQKKYQNAPYGFEKIIRDEKTGMKLHISDNCMEAHLLIPSSYMVTPQLSEILSFLRENEVEFGIQKEKILQMISDAKKDTEVCIAVGKPAEQGKDAWYEITRTEEKQQIKTKTRGGKVKQTQLLNVNTVEPGTLIALYHPSTLGQEGCTVTGIHLEGSQGQEAVLHPGKGVKKEENTGNLVATEKGYIYYEKENETISVWNVYTIEGDANCYNGNISFDGTIIVKGSVNDLTVITATNDIIIDGFVGNAILYAQGNIVLKGGMNGGGHGSVTAGGSVEGKFFEAVTIKAKGMIRGNYFLDCKIETDDQVIANGEKSRITGGQIIAAVSVEADYIGNFGTTSMTLNVGDERWIETKLRKYQTTLEKAKDETEQLNNGKDKLAGLMSEQELAKNAIHQKVLAALQTEQELRTQTEQEIEHLTKVLERASSAYVQARKELQYGVHIIVNRIPKEFTDTMMGVRITKDYGTDVKKA